MKCFGLISFIYYLVNFYKCFNFTCFSDQKFICVGITQLQFRRWTKFAKLYLFNFTRRCTYKIRHRYMACGVHGWRTTTGNIRYILGHMGGKCVCGDHYFQSKQGLKWTYLPLQLSIPTISCYISIVHLKMKLSNW